MIDTWSTVGSCAQIGKNCHISGGVGIGGVLEPVQAEPVIIEDDCFIGARSEVAEGVIVERGSVLAMGVFLGASTEIVDRATGEMHQGRVPAYSVVVPGTLAGQAPARRQPRPEPLLRRDRQAGRRTHPRQDLDQRVAARLMDARRARPSTAAPHPRAERDAGGRGRHPAARSRARAPGLRLRRRSSSPSPAPRRCSISMRGCGSERPQFLLRRPHRRGAAGRSRGLERRSLRRRGARRHALWPRRRRHEGRGRRLRRRPAPRSSRRAGAASTARSASSSPATRRPTPINGTRKVLDWIAAKGERLDACVVGEPTSAETLGDMVKIGRRGSLNGYPHGPRRAGPHRLSASRRQRGAPPRRHAARADQRARSTAATRISGASTSRSRPSISAIPPPTSSRRRRAPSSTSASTTPGRARRSRALAARDARSRRRALRAATQGERRIVPGAARRGERHPRRRDRARHRAHGPSSAPPAARRMRASSTASARSPSSACSASPRTRWTRASPLADIAALAEIYRTVLELYFARCALHRC